jgi:hypothetical protein
VTARRPRATPRTGVLLFGAIITVLAAVAFDLFAGEAPLHAATLGVITTIAAAVRVRLAVRQHSVVQFVCGCIVSQPVLHYAVKLLPHPNVEHGHGAAPGLADLFVAALQAMVIFAIVVGLTYAEQILLALAIGTAHVCIIRMTIIRPLPDQTRVVVVTAPATGLLARRYYPGSIARRGPPMPAPAI